jgi:hypothetical protein
MSGFRMPKNSRTPGMKRARSVKPITKRRDAATARDHLTQTVAGDAPKRLRDDVGRVVPVGNRRHHSVRHKAGEKSRTHQNQERKSLSLHRLGQFRNHTYDEPRDEEREIQAEDRPIVHQVERARPPGSEYRFE